MLLFSRFLSVSSLLHQTGPGLSCLRQKSLWHLSCSCVPGVVFGGGRRGKVRGGKSDAESRPPAPLRLAELISPSNHSWMFSMRSPQGGGWVPETQTELTVSQETGLGMEHPQVLPPHLCCALQGKPWGKSKGREDIGLGQSQSWNRFWAQVGLGFSIPAHKCSPFVLAKLGKDPV